MRYYTPRASRSSLRRRAGAPLRGAKGQPIGNIRKRRFVALPSDKRRLS